MTGCATLWIGFSVSVLALLAMTMVASLLRQTRKQVVPPPGTLFHRPAKEAQISHSTGGAMKPDRMQRQRFEYKYLVDETIALGVRDFVSAYLAFDDASVGRPNYSYRVNSIYLDSEQLSTFWDWVNSNRNRFKLRMRFYDAGPDAPVFLEIKRRLCGCILKQRCGIRRDAVSAVLAGQMPAPNQLVAQEPKHMIAAETFVSMTNLLQAQPKALVTYLREAYVDPENENVRVTLDRQVRIALCQSVDFNLNLRPYVQPFGDRIILELKFTNRYPTWFTDMVQRFGLTRSAAAKYCEGMANLLSPQHANWLTQPVDAPLVDSPSIPLLDAPRASASTLST